MERGYNGEGLATRLLLVDIVNDADNDRPNRARLDSEHLPGRRALVENYDGFSDTRANSVHADEVVAGGVTPINKVAHQETLTVEKVVVDC